MLYSLEGTLAVIEPFHVVIECAGVGYSVKTTMNTIATLPKVGEKTKLFTHLAVREDMIELFGFSDPVERQSFQMLIGISGVGPRAAISILSDLTPTQLALCVASGDVKSLTKAPGIGVKIAQRIVLELKDKVSKQQLAAGIAGPDISAGATAGKTGNAAEAITALEVLGYARAEATRVVTGLDSNLSVEEMIKQALKALARKV